MTEAESPKVGNSIWALAHELGKLGGAIAVIGAIASVVYDWGFFVALNLSFEEAPTSLTDHIHSWLIWLPRATVMIFLVASMEFFLRRTERGMTEEEIVTSSPTPRFTRIFRESPHFFVKLLGVYIVATWLLFGSKFTPIVSLPFGLIIVWFIFSGWIFNHPIVRERHSDTFIRLFFWIPPILVSIFFWGYISASTRISQERPNYIVSINSLNGSSVEGSEINLIRTFGNWILIDQHQGQALWIRLNEIEKLELIEESWQFPGMACLFFEYRCSDELPLIYHDP